MSLPKIRLERCLETEPGIWRLDAEQERHLVRVLRLYDGAMVEGLFAGASGRKVLLHLRRGEDAFFLHETDRMQIPADALRITLLIGLLKADQFETVLRVAAEIGVDEIVPVVCARSVPRIHADDLPKKMHRWKKILEESSKVSGEVFPPRLADPVDFALLSWDALPVRRFAAMLADAAPLSRETVGEAEVAIAVGPEGDWADGESVVLLREGFKPVSLGRRILRASTAATVACAWLRMNSL